MDVVELRHRDIPIFSLIHLHPRHAALAARAVLAAQVVSDVLLLRPYREISQYLNCQVRPTVMVELAAQVARAVPTWV